MEITEIVEISKSRCKVYIDYEIAFVLYKGDLRLYKLKLGSDISSETYKEICETVLVKRAKLRSLHLLKSRDYTEYQIREKLNKSGYPVMVIDKAIEYVKSYGYIDDEKYCERFIFCYYEFRSKKRMEIDLQKKGINPICIRNVYEHIKDEMNISIEDEMDVEIKQIESLLQKKKYQPEEATMKDRQKIYGFLLRKGYSMDNIKQAIGDYIQR